MVGVTGAVVSVIARECDAEVARGVVVRFY